MNSHSIIISYALDTALEAYGTQYAKQKGLQAGDSYLQHLGRIKLKLMEVRTKDFNAWCSHFCYFPGAACICVRAF